MLVPLADADVRCGSKAAGLGRLLRAGFAVPDGFVIEDPRAGGWERELAPALRTLGRGPYAVRSSAPGEDGAEASFAGQLHTTLNAATPVAVAAAVRRTAASGGDEKAVAYAARTGHPARAVVPVIVQVMVAPEAAGVAFTRHPVTGADQVVIEGAEGLGDRLLDGAVTPERWTVDGETATGPPAARALTARQALELARVARRIEDLFGRPQDIEWAIAGGRTWLLQARPITATSHIAARSATPTGRALVTGTPASPGTGAGRVRVITGLDDFARFAAGDVLVCRTTSPAWTPLLARAAAVVTETGGLLAHAAIVAREFAVPAVVAAEGAMTVLADGRSVVVDGTGGTVIAADVIAADETAADEEEAAG
jgi:pyruvate, water dikinase